MASRIVSGGMFVMDSTDWGIGGQTPLGEISSIAGPFFVIKNDEFVWFAEGKIIETETEIVCRRSSFKNRLMHHMETGNRLSAD